MTAGFLVKNWHICAIRTTDEKAYDWMASDVTHGVTSTLSTAVSDHRIYMGGPVSDKPTTRPYNPSGVQQCPTC